MKNLRITTNSIIIFICYLFVASCGSGQEEPTSESPLGNPNEVCDLSSCETSLSCTASGGFWLSSGCSINAGSPTITLLTSTSTDSISLAWFHADDDVTLASQFVYEIHISTTTDFTPNQNTLHQTVTGDNSIQISGLEADTKYYVLIVTTFSDNTKSSGREYGEISTAAFPVIPNPKVRTIISKNDGLGLYQSTDEGSTLTFTPNQGATIPASGDVIIAEDQSGNILLRQVNNILLSGANLTVETSQASLSDALSAASINNEIYLFDITKEIKKEYESNTMSEEEFENFLKLSNELATTINVNLNKTANLVRSFKQVAVDQTNEEKREFNLNNYMEEILLNINNVTNKTNIDININCAPNIVLNSYPGAFSQVITNLIINSIRHAYDEKEVGIITIDVSKEDKYLKLIYKDDGKGIPENDLPKIFDPFFTTNREKGGTGLGLNVIYNIVTTTLNGKIKCKSDIEKGVEFIMTIPIKRS